MSKSLLEQSMSTSVNENAVIKLADATRALLIYDKFLFNI